MFSAITNFFLMFSHLFSAGANLTKAADVMSEAAVDHATNFRDAEKHRASEKKAAFDLKL